MLWWQVAVATAELTSSVKFYTVDNPGYHTHTHTHTHTHVAELLSYCLDRLIHCVLIDWYQDSLCNQTFTEHTYLSPEPLTFQRYGAIEIGLSPSLLTNPDDSRATVYILCVWNCLTAWSVRLLYGNHATGSFACRLIVPRWTTHNESVRQTVRSW